MGVRWVIKQLPFSLMVALVTFGAVSTFEPILNGWMFGQLADINFHNMGIVGRYVLMATAAYFSTYLSLYLYNRVRQRAVRLLNQALKTVYFTTSMAEAGTKVTEVSDTINQVTSVGKQIEQNYFVALMDMFQEVFGVIVVVIFILKINAILSLIYVFFSVLSLLPSHFGRKRLDKNSRAWSRANASLVLNMKDIFQGRMEILNFKAWQAFFNRFRQHLAKEEEDYERLNNF
ncbi:ABC transporter permease, partial [Lacticaseibacillus rhamnosus]